MKSIKKFEGKKVELSTGEKGGARDPIFGERTFQSFNAGTDRIGGPGGSKTNVDWNPFNNDDLRVEA